MPVTPCLNRDTTASLCVSLGPREPLVAGTEVQSTDLWKVLSHLC